MRYSTGRRASGRGRSRISRRQQMRWAVFYLTLLTVLGVALRILSPSHGTWPTFSDYPGNPAVSRGALDYLAILSRQALPSSVRPGRPIYPYSVIPGGVRDPAELQRVSANDRVVSSHFAGFDYLRARVLRLPQAKEVYLSYRIGDRVFWTRKKVRLAAGEKLISDGKITARTRCANRVSETKQAVVSPQEPPAEKFEHPMGEEGSAMQFRFPSEFDSALLGRPQMPDPLPVTSSAGSLLPPLGGGWVGGLAPPPLPSNCETAAQEQQEKQLGIVDNEKSETHCPAVPTPPPATVPEPGTILLVSSGLAGVYLRYRNKSARQ